MTDPPAPPAWRAARRLGFRIAFLLAVVLLPLAVLSAYRSAELVAEAQARSEAALLGETVITATAEWRLIREAAGMAAALAVAVPDRIDDPACSDLFAAVTQAKPYVTFAGYVTPAGRISCSSAGAVLDVRGSPRHAEVVGADEPRVYVNPSPRISAQPVLTLTAPVPAAGVGGYVGLSIPMSALQAPAARVTPVPLLIFSAGAEVLMARPETLDPAAVLPADRSLKALAGPEAVAFTATDGSGAERVYAVIPLIPQQVYALGSRPAEAGVTGGMWLASMPVVAPALMWVASLGVALVAVHRLVIRYVARLSAAIRAFASGSRTVTEVRMDGAPLELAEIGEALETMMDNVIRDEAELEDMVHQREVLLREVHHRVKNNLQLVASIMNMQLRRAESPEARAALLSLQDRVLGLASVHRELFQTAGLADIHADELLGGIVVQLQNRHDAQGNGYAIARDVDHIRMTPDQAVPLALLATEGLGNAMRHAALTGQRTREIVFRLKKDGIGAARLEIENRLDETPDLFDATPPAAGLGAQLIAGFAQQLGGHVERTTADGRYVLAVRFPLRALSEGEARRRH